MSKTHIIILISIIISLLGCNETGDKDRISIIPLPVKIELKKGNFIINSRTSIFTDNSDLEFLATYAVELWKDILGFSIRTNADRVVGKTNSISLVINSQVDSLTGNEGYTIDIKADGIRIRANSPAGILYGIQSINQLLDSNPDNIIPCLTITDYPRFSYRGMHLDVSRHFMPIEFIYKLMDYLVMHKINVFHWHLVDDQGWRLEIRKYPKLTEIGAWRVNMEHRYWNDRPLDSAKNGKATYGGFYTQDEVKALVAYATQRNITVMPEIEMPAHVMSALAAYPEYSCTGENLGVAPGGVWPITHIYCAGNEATFQFIEDVLTEVMELFPSKYIHIGGDEADKSNWGKCPKCQKRIRDEKLNDEYELQSYFIKRIEDFLNKHNRNLVGWDEILEGGLAPNASVMSWRGEQGGIDAAKRGNTVIMSPGSHCYFDHYQGDPSVEPLANGGLTTLKKVYSYEPIPSELTEEEGKLVLGAQANHWTEFMPNPQQVEYMAFPRLAALSEVLWSTKESRNWGHFSQRMENQYKRYEKLGINHSLSAYQVNIIPELDPAKKLLSLELTSDAYNPQIRYTLDGSEPDTRSRIYKKPISINKNTTIKASVFENGKPKGHVRTVSYNIHKAFACKIELKNPNSPKYDGRGKYTLVDGIMGTINFADGNWKGFLGDDMVATIDLGKSTNIEKISVETLQVNASWIFLPQRAEFEVSTDGKEFSLLETIENSIPPSEGAKIIYQFMLEKEVQNVRYVRVNLKSIGVCPKGHSGEGNPAWMFVSEILVE